MNTSVGTTEADGGGSVNWYAPRLVALSSAGQSLGGKAVANSEAKTVKIIGVGTFNGTFFGPS